jgi:hypothetical protein
MSQSSPTIGANKSGLVYRQEDNDGKKALLNHHKGASAPDYKEAGVIWLDDAATPWLLKTYDGADWITLGAVHAGDNSFMPYVGQAPLFTLPHAADSGSANAYAVAPAPAIASYATGHIVTLKPVNTNTGAATLAVCGLTAKTIKMPDGTDTPPLALLAGGIYTLVYDGTHFIVTNPCSDAHVAARTISGSADFDDLTTAGLYVTSGSSYTNAPLGSAAHTGTLAVRRRTTSAPTLTAHITQTWERFDAAEEYRRISTDSGATWSAWQQVAIGQTSAVVVDRVHAAYSSNTPLGNVIPYDDTIPQSTEGTEILSVSITPKSSTNRLRVTFSGFGASEATDAIIIAAIFANSGSNALAAGATTAPEDTQNPTRLFLQHEFVAGSTSAMIIKVRIGGSTSSTLSMNGTTSARRFGGVAASTLIVEELSA